MGAWTPENGLYRSFGIRSQADLNREAKLFDRAICNAIHGASRRRLTGRNDNPLYWNLRNAFVRGDAGGLDRELKYSFQSFLLRLKFSRAVNESHKKLADLRFPYEWFPETRTMQRTIHLHVGPTNSGKTYNALKALESAKTGIYAGPLRLLAHEIYSRFKAKGIPCALVTGEEQRIPDGTDLYFSSCTVEMSPLGVRVDVAVIDEIQMIADEDRGWAWTQAVLGVQARELHLCGEERAVDLIQGLCARIGDKCVVHRYERLNPLLTMNESLKGDFKSLQKGDCIVSFTRVGLHTLKAGIEEATGRRCAIVYGSLPPETRAQQAALFNEPNNDYDFLVASDAIGMGLNLEIKRVIFESVSKYDGSAHRSLSIPEVKQIGGRAGRYRTASRDIKESGGDTTPTQLEVGSVSSAGLSKTPPASNERSVGLVTTLDEEDLESIKTAFKTDAGPLKTAGMLPPAFIIEQFFSYFPPDTPLSFVLARLREMAKLSESFEMCDFVVLLDVADAIQDLPLNIHDRCIFLTAPVYMRDFKQRDVLRALARCVAEMKVGHLLDIEEIDLEILDIERGTADLSDIDYLRRLEALHKSITVYLWLTYRYQGVFPSQHLAFHVKSLVEGKITNYLENLGFTVEGRRAHRKIARKLVEKQKKIERRLLGQEDNGHRNEEALEEEPLMDDEEEAEAAIGGNPIPDDGQNRGNNEARV